VPLLTVALLLAAAHPGRVAHSQAPARVAQIPGINSGPCNPGPEAAAEEPPKQLKGFAKIALKPGETRAVTMKLDKDTLAAWDSGTHAWKVYPGAYSVMVGSSSRDIRLKGSFTIPTT
jgi:hypothetical protein